MPAVSIDPTVSLSEQSIVGPAVKIGSNSTICSHVVIQGKVTIGSDVLIMPGAIIGMPSRERVWPQEAKEPPSLEPEIVIGDHTIIHELVTIRLPMLTTTFIGPNVVVGAHGHIAHDCWIRSGVRLAAGVRLGGYVTIGVGANLGLGVSVHPRTAIGAYAMCGVGAAVVRHIAPAATVAGAPARFLHANLRGLERANFDHGEITQFSKMLSGTLSKQAAPRVRKFMDDFLTDIQRWKRDVNIIPTKAP